MKSSNSFENFESIAAIQENGVILDILLEPTRFFAHTHKFKKKESLEEHIKLVADYFLKLVNRHQLDNIVDSLISAAIPQNISKTKEVGNYLKESFYKTILYHDFGKINHLFQWEKMENRDHRLHIIQHKVGSQHSVISTYIYLCHLMDFKKNNFTDEAQQLIATYLLALSYPIKRHHNKFIDKVEGIDIISPSEFKKYLNLFSFPIPDDIDLIEKIIGNSHSFIESFGDFGIEPFPIYALVKLNFSLLTASDYYATGEYKQDLKVEDFGLIEGDLKEKILQNIKTTKDYNQRLFNDIQKLMDQPFEELQDRSKNNLNLLRQKLAAEALTNQRKYKDSNLFYLEAPTGSGKTNVSLVLATELFSQIPVLNKVFYVSPFTTLVTQTFESIKDILKIDNGHIIQLHSKSGFHQKNEDDNDGNYGLNCLNFINNHFVNYPFTMLTHIKFFDILKGNSKDTNYIFHRLANSVVIIDELQSYNPKHWDKIIYFLTKYANLFNIKVILMSATLPKIGKLLTDKSLAEGIINLISIENKPKYFQNPNFAGRVEFDFTILDKWNWKKPTDERSKKNYLSELLHKVLEESEKYASTSHSKSNKVRTLVEFITKKTATYFFKLIQEDGRFRSYQLYLISGEILDSKRKHIIEAIKKEKDNKVILITTQVVEAGVDIDMDLGFKDRSLIDSDEQLAGRVNRNASKQDCKVFMFDFDKESFIYKGDRRLKIESMSKREVYKNILKSKDFDTNFYDLIQNEITNFNQNEAVQNFYNYLQEFEKFNFKGVNEGFKLIEQDTESIFIPLLIPKEHFSIEDQKLLTYFKIPDCTDKGEKCISGKTVWMRYSEIVDANQEKKTDYINGQILIKRIYSLLSKFMISVFTNQVKELEIYFEKEISDQHSIRYMHLWEGVYSYENGVNLEKVKEGNIFL